MLDYHFCRLTLIENIQTALDYALANLRDLPKSKEFITIVENAIA